MYCQHPSTNIFTVSIYLDETRVPFVLLSAAYLRANMVGVASHAGEMAPVAKVAKESAKGRRLLIGGIFGPTFYPALYFLVCVINVEHIGISTLCPTR